MIIFFMKKRTTRTYTIDDEIYKDFEKIIKDKHLNKSRLIESLITKFIVEENKN
jgi:metal-responsive CopG/Arc/MetJ family transcriptional regulator